MFPAADAVHFNWFWLGTHIGFSSSVFWFRLGSGKACGFNVEEDCGWGEVFFYIGIPVCESECCLPGFHFEASVLWPYKVRNMIQDYFIVSYRYGYLWSLYDKFLEFSNIMVYRQQHGSVNFVQIVGSENIIWIISNIKFYIHKNRLGFIEKENCIIQ